MTATPVPSTDQTVGQLRAALAALPDDMPVVLSKDAEGNGYSPLAEAYQAMYVPKSTWSGDAYLTPESRAELVSGGDYYHDEAPADAIRVLLLWPVN